MELINSGDIIHKLPHPRLMLPKEARGRRENKGKEEGEQGGEGKGRRRKEGVKEKTNIRNSDKFIPQGEHSRGPGAGVY